MRSRSFVDGLEKQIVNYGPDLKVDNDYCELIDKCLIVVFIYVDFLVVK